MTVLAGLGGYAPPPLLPSLPLFGALQQQQQLSGALATWAPTVPINTLPIRVPIDQATPTPFFAQPSASYTPAPLFAPLFGRPMTPAPTVLDALARYAPAPYRLPQFPLSPVDAFRLQVGLPPAQSYGAAGLPHFNVPTPAPVLGDFNWNYGQMQTESLGDETFDPFGGMGDAWAEYIAKDWSGKQPPAPWAKLNFFISRLVPENVLSPVANQVAIKSGLDQYGADTTQEYDFLGKIRDAWRPGVNGGKPNYPSQLHDMVMNEVEVLAVQFKHYGMPPSP